MELSIFPFFALTSKAFASSQDGLASVSMNGACFAISCRMASLTICQERSTLSALSATKNKVVSKDASGLFLIGVPMGNPPIFNGVHLYYLCGHFQFLGGCDAADSHVRAVVVVSPEYPS